LLSLPFHHASHHDHPQKIIAVSPVLAAMEKGLLNLPEKLNPLFISHELGYDLKLDGGQNHPAGKNRSVVWSCTFGCVQDYEKYDTSDEHVDVVTNLIKPIIVPGSRSAIQHSVE